MSETRGVEATGIFYTKDDTYSIEKQPISSSVFIKEILPKHIDNIKKANIAFGHTRLPTQGSPKDNNNNHPIDSENWVLIHNGNVTKMPRLNDYNYKGEVDSEILISYIEKYGLKEGLPYIERGSAAVALINKHDLNSIYLWRETSSLIIACDSQSNTLFFASQKEFLEKSLTNKFLLFTSFQSREVPSNLLIKITINPFDITSMGYIKVMKYNPIRYTYAPVKNEPTSFNNMVFNDATNRWELSITNLAVIDKSMCAFLTGDNKCSKGYTTPCPTNKYICDYFTHELHTNITLLNKKNLKDRGFTDDEINRMAEATIATIYYCDYNGTEVSITASGGIQVLAQKEPCVENKSLEVLRSKIATIPYLNWMADFYGTPVWKEIWDDKIYLHKVMTEYVENLPRIHRYYINTLSKDFKNWSKLTKPNKGHLSTDGVLIKKWDDTRKSHYIMLVEDAIKEKLIDEVALQEDLDYESDEYISNINDRIDMED